jgi:glycyl-tRNA synthetase
MQVFKEYEQPVEKEQRTVKPVMAKLGPVFKGEAAKVAEALSKTNPQELEAAFKKEGHYILGKHRILPEHVDIDLQKTVERGRHYIPHVVEPSFGSDRLLYVTLEYAYHVKEDRALLSFPRDISPIQVGVYPLLSKDGLPEKAMAIHAMLVEEGFITEYDEAGSIGRRYARADEVGVQLGITVDYDTLKDDTVTVRDRDSWKQIRCPIGQLRELLRKYFLGKVDFGDLGKAI